MSEEGGSSSQGSCGQLKDVTHDVSETSSKNSQLDLVVNQQKPCVGPATESSVQQPVDRDQGTHAREEQTLEYRETSPTLELNDIFTENREVVLDNSPSAQANISDMSSP